MPEVKRVARHVEDDDEDKFVIEQVYHLEHTGSTRDVVDPFAATGEGIKTMRGTTSNFKRRVSNELKKYNRSADHAVESKQITDGTVYSGYDAFGVVTPPHSLEGLAVLYDISSPHHAAVDAKVANIVGLGYKLVETTKTKRVMEEAEDDENKTTRLRRKFDLAREELNDYLDGLNEEETFTEILIKVWTDFETLGNGYLEVGRNKDGSIGYVGHIPGQTIRIRRDRDGFVQISADKAQFFRNFGDDIPNPIGGDPNPNELIHFKSYSPTSTYYGVPDIVSAQGAIVGNEFSSRFNIEYFENKAVPRHLITLKGANLGSSAQADLLTFFETGLKGQNHRSLFIPLPADDATNKVEFKIEAIEAGVQDSSFEKYQKSNDARVLMSHRVPISKVNTAEGASLAIARDADKTFKEQVCQPRQRIAEKKINRIVKELTDAFELKLNEMTLTDANTQSQIDERMVKVGVWTPNEVRIRDGMPGIDGGDERVDLNAANKLKAQQNEMNAERQRDSARSAGATDSAGEARNPKGEGRTTP